MSIHIRSYVYFAHITSFAIVLLLKSELVLCVLAAVLVSVFFIVSSWCYGLDRGSYMSAHVLLN